MTEEEKTCSIFKKLAVLRKDTGAKSDGLGLSFLCAFTFSFTFLLFGPIEIYLQNYKYISFSFTEMILPISITAVVFFLVMSVIFTCTIRWSRVFRFIVSGMFAATVAGYLQGLCLNIDHGVLDGSSVHWPDYKWAMLLNCIIWFAIFLVVYILSHKQSLWSGTIFVCCISAVGAQLASIPVLLTNVDMPTLMSSQTEIRDYYISEKDMFTVSSSQNVIVFLLDRMDNLYMEQLLAEYPEWEDQFRDFIYYRNFTGSYRATMPSITYLLTGVQEDYTIPVPAYFKKAWEESTLLSDIHDAGNVNRIYVNTPYVVSDTKNVLGLFDNLEYHGTESNNVKLVKKMLMLSVYRYAPEVFKPYFHISTAELETVIEAAPEHSGPYAWGDDVRFWDTYQQQGLTVESHNKGAFLFYHLAGAHPPYRMDENAHYITEGEESWERQATGNIRMILQYIQELDERGVLDQTTVVITADHGYTGTVQELDYVRKPLLMIKPANARTGASMQISNKEICQDNLRASIAEWLGVDSSAYGRTIESIGETEPMVRYFWFGGADSTLEHREANIITYEIRGDANDLANYKKIAVTPTQYPFYDP